MTNAEGPGSASTQSLYTGTTQSVNVFFAELEQKVGLCNVVHTAVDMGMTRADGTSLLKADGSQDSADNIPSFTLGSVNVSPLSMAAAYATVADRGIYCSPVAIGKIVDSAGKSLAVPSANCHRALSSDVADAVNYILQGVLTSGTAANVGGLSGREAAGKTGTSNVEGNNGTPYAAFAGYTPSLVGYVSVFNPISPTGDTMGGSSSCYRLESGSLGLLWRDVRGERARVDLAHDVRQRRPRAGHLLRARSGGQPVQQHGQRPGRHPAEEAEERQRRR